MTPKELYEGIDYEITQVIKSADMATKQKIADLLESCSYMDDFGHVVFKNWDHATEFIDRLMLEFKL